MVYKPLQTFFIFSCIIFTQYTEAKPHLFIKDGTLHLGIPYYGSVPLSDGLNWGNTGTRTTGTINSRTDVNGNPCGPDGCQVDNNEGGYISVQSSAVLPTGHVSTSDEHAEGSSSNRFGSTHFSSSSSSTSAQNEYHTGMGGANQGNYGLMYPTITIKTQGGYIPPKQTPVQTDSRFGSNNNNEVYISGTSTNNGQLSTGQTDTSAGSYNNRASFGFGTSSFGSTGDSTSSQTQTKSDNGAATSTTNTGFSMGSSNDQQSSSDVGGSYDVGTSNTNHVRSIDSQSSVNSASDQNIGIGISSSSSDTGSVGAYPSYSSSYDGSSGSTTDGTQYSVSSSYDTNQGSSGTYYGSTDQPSSTGYVGTSVDTGYSTDCGLESSQASDSSSNVGTQGTSQTVGSSFEVGSRSGYDASSNNDAQFSFDAGSRNHVRSIESQSSTNDAASQGSSTSMSSSSNGYNTQGSFGLYPMMPSVVYRSHVNNDVATANDAQSRTSGGSQFSFTSNAGSHNTETQSSVNKAGQTGTSNGIYVGGSFNNQPQAPETAVVRTRTNYEPSVAVQSDTRSSTDQTKVSFGSTTQPAQPNGVGLYPLSITIHTHGGYVPPPTTVNTEVGTQTGLTSTGQDNKIDVRFNGNSGPNSDVSSTNTKSNTGFGVAVSSHDTTPKATVSTTNDASIDGNLLFPGLTFETRKRHIPSGSNVNTNTAVYVTASEPHHRHHPSNTGVIFSVQPPNGYIGGTVGTDASIGAGVRHHHRTSTKSNPAIVIPFPLFPFIGTGGGTSISSRNSGGYSGTVSANTGLGALADTLANGFSFGIHG